MAGNLLDRLSDRAAIPELEVLQLPDDWRADQTRDPEHFCATCQWNGRWDQLLERRQIPPDDERTKILPHALRESASAGNLCCAILFALSRKLYFGENESERLLGGPVYVTKSGINFWDEHRRHELAKVYISSPGLPSQAPAGATVYSHGSHPSIDPGSEKSLDWAKGLIDECVNTHNCHTFQSKEPQLPTRLVYVPEDATISGVRLIDNSDTRLPRYSQYAALSHCWGKVTPSCSTTTHNVNKFTTEGIPWGHIPRTFQDAMLYVRRLKLEYIWIDSMCIIQGDDEDWKLESTKMFQYYSNAYITLASTFSTNCNGGFYSERHVKSSRLYLLDVEFRGERYPVYAFRHIPQGKDFNLHEVYDSKDYFNQFPLLKRSWIFQERLVSPRLLYFTQKQLIFDCYTSRRFQETDEASFSEHKQQYGAVLRRTYGRKPEDLWQDLVGAFSSLGITYPKDKLPAVAAVAKQLLSFQAPHSPKQEYLCGLRKSYLHLDLSWHNLDPRPLPRGQPYLAPSWSWASLPTKANFNHPTTDTQRRSTVTLRAENLNFAGDDRFGPVLEGFITVEAPAIECIWAGFSDHGLSYPLRFYRRDVLILPKRNSACFFPVQRDYTDNHFNVEDHVQDHVTDYLEDLLSFFSTEPKVSFHYPGPCYNRLATKKLILLQVWASEDEKEIGYLVLYKNRVTGRYHRLGVGEVQCGYSSAPSVHTKEAFGRAKNMVFEIE